MGLTNRKQYTLYYFSGTGNSLATARSLASELPSCELTPIIKQLKENTILTPALVGLVFPTHHMGIPGVFRSFIESADWSQTNYVFAVIGGGNPRWSATFHQLQKELNKKGIKLHAGFYLSMQATYFSLLRHPGKIKPMQAARQFQQTIRNIAQQAQACKKNTLPGIRSLGLINKIKTRNLHKTARNFHLDEGCIRCGYCQMVCPAQNIQIRNKRPNWSDQCLSCFACIHNCSQGIIQYKKLSQGMERYRHPGVTVGDLAGQKR